MTVAVTRMIPCATAVALLVEISTERAPEETALHLTGVRSETVFDPAVAETFA